MKLRELKIKRMLLNNATERHAESSLNLSHNSRMQIPRPLENGVNGDRRWRNESEARLEKVLLSSDRT